MRLNSLADALSYAVMLVVVVPLALVAAMPALLFADVLPRFADVFAFVVSLAVSALLFHQVAGSVTGRDSAPLSIAAWRGGAPPGAGARWIPHVVRCVAPYALLLFAVVLALPTRADEPSPHVDAGGVWMVLAGVALGAVLADARRCMTRERARIA